MWIFVRTDDYLPAYSLPADRGAKPPRPWQYVAAPVLTILGVVPGGILAAIFRHLRPPHIFLRVY